MAIKIDRNHFELIKAYGEESYPYECCGFLMGVYEGDIKQVLATFPVANAREESERHHRYLITPDDFLLGQKYARERNMEIIGFYHSHPDAEARPSRYDLEHGWPWYSYVIISVIDRQAREVTSWVLEDDRTKFTREEMIVAPE